MAISLRPLVDKHAGVLAMMLITAQTLGQNAIVGEAFSATNGWGLPCTNNSNFALFSSSIGSTYISAPLTPTSVGDRSWRLAVDWSGTTKQLTNTIAIDELVAPGTKYTLSNVCTGSGSLKYNIASTAFRYIFKTLNAGINPTGTWVFFEIQGTEVRAVSNLSRTPSDVVLPNQPVDISVTMNGSVYAGQGVYLRFTKDNFVTSQVVEMSGSGANFSTTIPAAFVTGGATIQYYVFTSGSGLTIAPADCDLYAINQDNNGGANYSFIVPTSLFRSKAPGPAPWSDPASWQMSHDNGMSWQNASASPTAANASTITIQNGHTISLDANVSIDEVVVESGGILQRLGGNPAPLITLNDGPGADLVVQSNAQFRIHNTNAAFDYAQAIFFTGNAKILVASGGTLEVNISAGSNFWQFAAEPITRIEYQHNATFYWNVTGTIGFGSAGTVYFPGVSASTIPVFKINASIAVGATSNTTINGVVEMAGGKTLTLQSSGTKIFRNGIIGAGLIQLTDNGPLWFTGITSQLGGGSLNLNSAGLTIRSGTCTLASNKVVNGGPLSVDAGATINTQSNVLSGTGSFNLNSGATLVTSHSNGVDGVITFASAGNIFAAGSHYHFNGSIAQTTGSRMATTVGSLFINNPASVTLSKTGHTASNLYLMAGSFRCGINGNLNIANGGTINSSGGNQPNSADAGTINFLGSVGVSGYSNGTPQLYSVILNGNTDFNGSGNTFSGSIWSRLQINAGGLVTDAPYYASGSTLVYNSGGSYSRGVEWSQPAAAMQGYPHHVLVQNSTTLNLGYNNPPAAGIYMGGDLFIGSSSSSGNMVDMNNYGKPLVILGNLVIGDPATTNNRLRMSTSSGGDLWLYGNFTRHKNTNYYDNEDYGVNGGRGRATIFKGAINQIVDVIDLNNPSNEIQKFHKMVMDQASTGEVTIKVPNLYIEHELELKNGIIHSTIGNPPGSPAVPPGDNNGLLTIESAAIISGTTSATCFVNGQMVKAFGLATTNRFIFPVGKKGAPIPDRPFWFSKTNTLTGSMRGEYFPVSPPQVATNITEYYLTSLMGIVNSEYWQFDQVDGTIAGRIILDYKNPGNGKWRGPSPSGLTSLDPCNNCNVAVVRRSTNSNNGNWDFTSTSGIFSSQPADAPEYRWHMNNGLISSAVLTSFGPFTFGFSYHIILGTALPLKLLAFDGNLCDANACLQWRIDKPNELLEFEVQHSINGQDFFTAGRILPGGTEYQFRHKNLQPGLNYYRLMVRENSGKSFLSQVVTVSANKQATQVNDLQSKAATDLLTANIFSANAQQAFASIYNHMGQCVYYSKVALAPGENKFYIPITALSKGVYHLKLMTADGAQKTLRWMKE